MMMNLILKHSDLAETFAGQIKPFFQDEWIPVLLREARSTRYSRDTRETARWAKEVSFFKKLLI